jgi:carboxypeptidase C (cathepsin A)
MLWVDQPIGTGYSTGTAKATTQEETAQDFLKFLKNFEEIFGIKNYKIYVTGESCEHERNSQVLERMLTIYIRCRQICSVRHLSLLK